MIKTSADAYFPHRIQASVGDTVIWTRNENVDHEIDFTGNPTTSEEENLYLFLPKRKTVSLVISKSGAYGYKCSWHGIHGEIEVLPGE